MGFEEYMVLIISISTLISMISILVGCLCCKRRVIKNELLGLEGLVKIKNPDENLTSSVISVEPKITGTDSDIRRASNAPHRSLPDIPSDPIGDTNSQLYATVGDQAIPKPQTTSSMKKQASVSQHSSMSQADDVSSPYARVMSPPHSYDQVRHTEHPYAQLNSGPCHTLQVTIEENVNPNPISKHESNESLINIDESAEIPAASAIAGRIAASQELPYMTPPIVQLPQQNFSGDSQDSSKGYTSISVREPLANIIALTNQQNAQLRRRDISDSHYATVSDDSDEMYAAIDDPNNQGELYTSGSETYAQIQPPNAFTVSVEVNAIPSSIRLSHELGVSVTTQRLSAAGNTQKDDLGTVNQTENLKASMHSRQASSSSCTSSMGNLGSPKPEKRQANSPLPPPPTPKTSVQSHHSSNTNLSTSSTRNSVVINKSVSKENLVNEPASKLTNSGNDENGAKKKQSPSKDLEGMYAKVMKKNKLSNFASQNSSPILSRKLTNNITENVNLIETVSLDSEINNPEKKNKSGHSSPSKTSIKSTHIDNNYETIDKRRARSNSYDHKDPGYETIPGDKGNNDTINMNKSFGDFSQIKSRLSAPVGTLAQGIHRVSQNTINIFHEVEKYTTEPGYESLPDIKTSNDSSHQLLSQPVVVCSQQTSSEYDPNYEVLRPSDMPLDDGYAKVLEINKKLKKSDKINDGYSSIKNVKQLEYTRDLMDNVSGYSIVSGRVNNDHGYSSIQEKPKKNHDYASIRETNKEKEAEKQFNNNIEEDSADLYSIIPPTETPNYLGLHDISNNYSTIDETQPTYSNISDIPLLQNTVISPSVSAISDTKTTPSTDSNSSDIQLGYNNIQRTVENQQPNCNYESLTGSESDPNYESVKYLNIKENPYERLHNENSISPEALTLQKLCTDNESSAQAISTASVITNDNTNVGDYFQV